MTLSETNAMYYSQTHHVSTVDKIPTTAHFAVIQQTTKSYPDGYSNNGGYVSETVLEYIAFDTEDALKHWIAEEAKSRYSAKTYKVIHVRPVDLQITLSVKLSD